MQEKLVTRSKFQVSGWFAALFAVALTSLTGCSPKSEDTRPAPESTPIAATPDDSDLLLRVRFAGTAQLMTQAQTNATYLTNLAALPETAALGQRLVERMASLPGRLLTPGSTNHALATNLAPIFSNLLQQGFALELRGDSNGVSSMILAAADTALKVDQLQTAMAGENTGRSSIQSTNGWTTWTVGASPNHHLSSIIHHPTPPSILAVDLASTLLPNPIRESVYGGFERFSFTAVPTEHGFKIRGDATYAHDLPALSGPVSVPTNLVTEPIISFSMVRNPLAWLSSDNPLRNFLPEPFPDIAWFWGGDSSPYQLFMAIPLADTNRFATEIGPGLAEKFSPVAAASGTGPVTFDSEAGEVQWALVPFLSPRVVMQPSGTNAYLVARTFPPAEMGQGVTSPLLDRTSGTTNVVVFDWEFTQARIDAWSCLSQLALHLSSHAQLDASNVSWQWLRAAQKIIPQGGNMFTLINQTTSNELSLDRLAPVGFSSVELFWLANWMESGNFPAANFLVSTPNSFATPETEKKQGAE